MSDTKRCDTCIFWNPEDGECDAVSFAPEPVCKFRIYELDKTKEIRVFRETELPEEYTIDLITPADHFCASWQSKDERVRIRQMEGLS